MDLKYAVRQFLPPIALRFIERLKNNRAFKEWEYIEDGWKAEKADPKIKGWNVEGVLESYKEKWPAFIKSLEEPVPFGISPESTSSKGIDIVFHNTLMSYAYALALASRYKKSISMLDWGGGIGHYYLISKALIPDLNIDYHCKDVPMLVDYGKKLLLEAHFYSDESCLSKKYDFVLASSSLHYSQEWFSTLKGLAKSTSGYLFVTRLPVILGSPSFVFVQRPYKYGYNTEYLGWCINRSELLKYAEATGLKLMREFVTGERPNIYRAPEQPEYRGYLFRQSDLIIEGS